MARLRAKSVPPLEDVELFLILGPAEDHELSPELLEVLEAGWHAHGVRIMADYGDRDRRPWGLETFGPP